MATQLVETDGYFQYVDDGTNPDFGSGSGGGSGFDWSGLVNGFVGAIPGILGGSANLYAATHGQPQPYVGANGQLIYPGTQPVVQPQNNTWIYIVIVIVVLLLLLGGAYFLTRK
jgi:hypothetical protein